MDILLAYSYRRERRLANNRYTGSGFITSLISHFGIETHRTKHFTLWYSQIFFILHIIIFVELRLIKNEYLILEGWVSKGKAVRGGWINSNRWIGIDRRCRLTNKGWLSYPYRIGGLASDLIPLAYLLFETGFNHIYI